jgi:hypothetical protein
MTSPRLPIDDECDDDTADAEGRHQRCDQQRPTGRHLSIAAHQGLGEGFGQQQTGKQATSRPMTATPRVLTGRRPYGGA